MDHPRRGLAGAILTGGASSRMGRDKAFVEVDGVPMAARMVATLRAATCEPVVFVGGDERLQRLGAAVVADSTPGAGPLGGVLTALDTMRDRSALVVVVSCDLPFLGAEHLAPLVRTADDGAGDVVVARSDRREPLCAVWSTSAADQVRLLFEAGVRSMHGALDALQVDEVSVPLHALRNINTLGDLDQ